MRVREVLNAWLQGSRRSYAEGLALFDMLADPSMKERYGRYLHEVDDAACTDIHYNMLKGKLGFISRTIQCNPLPYRDTLLTEFVTKQAPVARQSSTRQSSATAEKVRIERPGHGIRIVDYPDLPEKQRAEYDRIKQLVPIKAKLHSELSAVPEEEAGGIADELCKVDDELRALWDDLDAWADGHQSETTKTPDGSPVSEGLELARREKKLRDNIRTNRALVEKYESENNAAKAEAARRRLAKYEQEMEELKKKISDEEAAS